MRAIVLEKFGGLDSLVYKDIPEPEPKAGQVVIQIKAFGLNHAELHMRRGEWSEAAPVSGIECVGLVKSSPGGEFPVSSQRFQKPTRLPGRVCSAISKSKAVSCSSSAARPRHSVRPRSRWPSTPEFE